MARLTAQLEEARKVARPLIQLAVDYDLSRYPEDAVASAGQEATLELWFEQILALDAALSPRRSRNETAPQD